MIPPDTEFIHIMGTSGGPGESPARPAPKTLPEVLPILGLSDIVIFPGMVVPLLVESTQSTRLIDDVVSGDRFLGLILQRNAESDNPKPHELYRFGCVGRVMKMLKFPDSTVRVLIEGLRRFEVKEFVHEDPYLCAQIQSLPDVQEESLEMTAMARNAQLQFQEILNLSPALSEQVKVNAIHTDQAGKLADLIAANLNLNLEERQALLEIPDVKERLTRLLPLMQREQEVLSLGSKIQKEVATSMSKTQRDFFLREQIRAIQRELGESDPNMADAAQLRDLIDANKLPDDVKRIALKELERLQAIPFTAAEYTVSRNYLDWLVNLPWSRSTEDKIDLKTAARILDEQHFGLQKVKDRLLEFLAVLKLKHQLKGPILCLAGPPGVGKTSLGKSVADALGRKFVRIALGGMRDEAEIRGHRRTYVSALPGRMLQSLRRVDSNNPVILLDEIDKVGSDYRGDPAAALLEVLDPAQNHTFTDNYLDVPFDLSRVLFITTANWLDPIHPALRDRLEIIEIPSYTAEEKLQIAKRHLLPRQLEEHGLKKKHLRVPDATMRKLIQDYTREAGVRNLEREIGSLVRKVARQIVSTEKIPSTITLQPKELTSLLGPSKFKLEAAEKLKVSGIAIGLAWTPVGGDILFIEATRMPGRGKLILTGSLGDVMKESAQTALSYLRSQAEKFDIDVESAEKEDVHIHVPAGATPKDGPSAGAAIVVALASLLTRRMVRSDLAMTGEISLRGRVLPVGGVKEKVLAASRSRLKQVILPEDNRKDWNEVPAEVRSKISAHFVKHISELVQVALSPK